MTTELHYILHMCSIGELKEDIVVNLDRGVVNKCLETACLFGQYNTVNLLLKYSPDNIGTCLLIACRTNNYNIAKLLISHGILDYYMGFDIACQCGYNQIAPLYIDHNNSDLNRCMEIACKHDCINIIKLLIKRDVKVTKYHFKEAYDYRHYKVAVFLIKNEPSILNDVIYRIALDIYRKTTPFIRECLNENVDIWGHDNNVDNIIIDAYANQALRTHKVSEIINEITTDNNIRDWAHDNIMSVIGSYIPFDEPT